MKQKPLNAKSCLMGCGGLFSLVCILGAVISFFTSDSPTTQKPTPKDDLKSQLSAWDGSHTKTVLYTKKLMHNPRSFEHVETKYNDFASQGFRIIHMKYRGTNLYNAIVSNNISVKVNLKGDVMAVLSQK